MKAREALLKSVWRAKKVKDLSTGSSLVRILIFLISIQVEGGVQVPFRAELGHRQEAGGETSDLEEAGCRVFRDTVVQKNIENWKHKKS